MPTGWPAGPAYLGVILDNLGFVGESNKTNNIAAVPIYLLPTGPYTWTVTSALDDIQEIESLRFALTCVSSSLFCS